MWGLRFGVWGLGFGVWSLGFGVLGWGTRDGCLTRAGSGPSDKTGKIQHEVNTGLVNWKNQLNSNQLDS